MANHELTYRFYSAAGLSVRRRKRRHGSSRATPSLPRQRGQQARYAKYKGILIEGRRSGLRSYGDIRVLQS